jgi:hypothetical protein
LISSAWAFVSFDSFFSSTATLSTYATTLKLNFYSTFGDSIGDYLTILRRTSTQFSKSQGLTLNHLKPLLLETFHNAFLCSLCDLPQQKVECTDISILKPHQVKLNPHLLDFVRELSALFLQIRSMQNIQHRTP